MGDAMEIDQPSNGVAASAGPVKKPVYSELVYNCECDGYKYYKCGENTMSFDSSGFWYLMDQKTGCFELYTWEEGEESANGAPAATGAQGDVTHAPLGAGAAGTTGKAANLTDAIKHDDQGRPIFPKNAKGQPMLPTDAMGLPIFPTNRDGHPIFPQDDKSGEPIIPVSDTGKPVFPTGVHGKPVVPLDSNGVAVFPIADDGTYIFPETPEGKPVPPVTIHGNPVVPFDSYGNPVVPYDANNRPYIYMGGPDGTTPMTEEEYSGFVAQWGQYSYYQTFQNPYQYMQQELDKHLSQHRQTKAVRPEDIELPSFVGAAAPPIATSAPAAPYTNQAAFTPVPPVTQVVSVADEKRKRLLAQQFKSHRKDAEMKEAKENAAGSPEASKSPKVQPPTAEGPAPPPPPTATPKEELKHKIEPPSTPSATNGNGHEHSSSKKKKEKKSKKDKKEKKRSRKEKKHRREDKYADSSEESEESTEDAGSRKESALLEDAVKGEENFLLELQKAVAAETEKKQSVDAVDEEVDKDRIRREAEADSVRELEKARLEEEERRLRETALAKLKEREEEEERRRQRAAAAEEEAASAAREAAAAKRRQEAEEAAAREREAERKAAAAERKKRDDASAAAAAAHAEVEAASATKAELDKTMQEMRRTFADEQAERQRLFEKELSDASKHFEQDRLRRAKEALADEQTTRDKRARAEVEETAEKKRRTNADDDERKKRAEEESTRTDRFDKFMKACEQRALEQIEHETAKWEEERTRRRLVEETEAALRAATADAGGGDGRKVDDKTFKANQALQKEMKKTAKKMAKEVKKFEKLVKQAKKIRDGGEGDTSSSSGSSSSESDGEEEGEKKADKSASTPGLLRAVSSASNSAVSTPASGSSSRKRKAAETPGGEDKAAIIEDLKKRFAQDPSQAQSILSQIKALTGS